MIILIGGGTSWPAFCHFWAENPKRSFFLYFFEKKSSKVCYIQKRSYLCNRKTERDSKFGLWCNGNTTDSGPVIPGSNPGSPTDEKKGKLLEKKAVSLSSFFFMSLAIKGIILIFALVNHRIFHLNKSVMKTRQFLAMLMLLVGAMAFGGCSDEDDPYYHSVPGGGFAYRANTVHFYYIGEDGNSLIEQSLPATYPLPCEDKEAQLPVPEVDEFGYYSSGSWTSCQIAVDEAGTPYFSCYFPIDQSTDTYTFYVYSNGSFDRFELTYGYTNDGVGGDGWIAHVLSLKINGRHVYSDEENKNLGCSVYIRKSAAGTQEVWSEYD